MCEYNLSVRSLYSSISNQDLDVIVEQIQQRFGLCARASTSPRNQGPTTCQRESKKGSVVLRRLTSINGPLALWHIDGNHKLIRLSSLSLPSLHPATRRVFPRGTTLI